MYARQLKTWFGHIPQGRFLILKSEELFQEPSSIIDQVQGFLNVAKREIASYRIFNRGNYPPMNSMIRKKLVEFYEPYNRELYRLLGRDFGWDS